jgi:hypothetical protein
MISAFMAYFCGFVVEPSGKYRTTQPCKVLGLMPRSRAVSDKDLAELTASSADDFLNSCAYCVILRDITFSPFS